MQKIKKDLIHKAKLKKEYAKLKAREEAPSRRPIYGEEGGVAEDDGAAEPVPEPSLEPHPERLKMLQERSPEPAPERPASMDRRRNRPRPQPFRKETELGQKRKSEEEARRKAREEAEQERARKLAEREHFRKAMAKARGRGPNGQRKLGRESTVLLEKAKRLVGKT